MSQSRVLDFGADDVYEYQLELRSVPMRAREVQGTEGVSRQYRFDVRFRAESGAIPEPEKFVGNDAMLRVLHGTTMLRYVVGIVTEASLEATAKGDPELHVVLEPQMSLLKHTTDHRVFRDKTVPEIVTDVLAGFGVRTILRLNETYKRRPYTTMYAETLLDFVHRLLEEEGIFYFFPEWPEWETPAEQKVTHGVVLGDGAHAYEAIEGETRIARRDTAKLATHDECVHSIKAVARMRPGKVSLRDWNLERPSAPMDVSAELARYDEDSVQGPEVYLYPGKYDVPAEGQRIARLLAEAYVAKSERIVGKSAVVRFMPGRTFTMEPAGDLAAAGVPEQTVVVLGLTHDYVRAQAAEGTSGAKSQRLDIGFEALPTDIPFRPEVVTPKPSVTNPHTAFVTGPKGEDIHTDEYGRVKLHFQWDRYQALDDHSSHWVPVMQENTGTSAAIPRTGWEMAVGFLGGDPDRPFALGRVYNGQDPFPEALPAGKTKSALSSLSSPGRDGANEIWMNDAAGSELMSIQAEKDKNVVVAKNKVEDVKNTEDNTIVKDETISIGANNTVTVTKAQVLAVDGNQSITVAASRKRNVKAADQLTVAKNRTVGIGSLHFRRIGGFDNTAEKKSLAETVGGVEIEINLKSNVTNAALLQTLTVGGAVVEIAGKGKGEQSELLRIETIGLGVITAVKEKFSLKAVKKRATKVGATFFAKVTKTLKLASETAEVMVKAKATGKAHADTTVLIEVGKNTVLLNKDGMVITTTGTLDIVADGANDLVAAQSDIA